MGTGDGDGAGEGGIAFIWAQAMAIANFYNYTSPNRSDSTFYYNYKTNNVMFNNFRVFDAPRFRTPYLLLTSVCCGRALCRAQNSKAAHDISFHSFPVQASSGQCSNLD
eukprot:5822923-Pleurochrysis_carterae.AAC.2